MASRPQLLRRSNSTRARPFIALFLQSSAHWSFSQIGAALAFGNFLQLLVQTPVGAAIDRYAAKRILLGIATAMVAVACGAMLFARSTAVVWGSQGLTGLARAIFPPALSAITLGMFRKAGMDRQTGISQSYNAAGSVFTAVALGIAGYAFGLMSMFYVAIALCVASLFCLSRIRGEEIDFEAARGNEGDAAGGDKEPASFGQALRELIDSLRTLVRNPDVRRFLACAVLFYVADVAMVPLVTQVLSRGRGAKSALIMTSSYVVASQCLLIGVAALCGRLSASLGRRPLVLFAFVALAARAGVYAMSDQPLVLLAAQCSDAFSTGVFGVVGVLIVSDFSRDTGRFNAALGAVATVQGIGAFLSNSIAGYLADAVGKQATFLALAGVALVGLVIAFRVPETRQA